MNLRNFLASTIVAGGIITCDQKPEFQTVKETPAPDTTSFTCNQIKAEIDRTMKVGIPVQMTVLPITEPVYKGQAKDKLEQAYKAKGCN